MSSSGEFDMDFTWKIENCDFMWYGTYFPDVSDGEGIHFRRIRSPPISVGNPCYSLIYLNLYVHTVKWNFKTISIQLKYLEGSFLGDFHGVAVLSCRRYEEYKLPITRNLEKGDKGIQVDVNFTQEETLTLRCRLKFCNPPPQYTACLLETQQKISDLLLTGRHSDITLRTGHEELFVHKFLLHKRAPKLLEDLGVLDENRSTDRVAVCNISTPVLKCLLEYIYTGKLDLHLEESCLLELFAILEKYKIKEWNRGVLHLADSATVTSQLKVIRKTIWCKADVYTFERDNLIYFEHVNFDGDWFLIEVRLKTFPNTALGMQIQWLSPTTSEILMCYSIASLSGENDLKLEKKDTLKFNDRNRSKHVSEQIERCVHLQITFAVSRGQNFISVDSMIANRRDHFTMFGMGVLKSDVSQLDVCQKFNFESGGDVILSFDCGRKLSAHRAILATWSPIFSGAFNTETRENNSDEMIISDMDYNTGLRLVKFLYTKDVDQIRLEDVKLYAAAYKYKVSSLFALCSSFFATHIGFRRANISRQLNSTHIGLENVLNTLVLADQYSDVTLFEAVETYMSFNAQHVLGLSEWLGFTDTHPQLVKKILLYLTNILRLTYSLTL